MAILFTSLSEDSKHRLLLIALTLFCLFSFSYNLDQVPPYSLDETKFVLTAKNMVDSGDYLTPQYHDRNRFDKPVLFYWLVAIFYKLFGINLAAARWVSVVFGVLSIWVVYFLAKRLFDRQTALLSAFILPSFYTFIKYSRLAVTDMALSFFILLAFFFFVRGYQDDSGRKSDYPLFYACMALGFMIKGPAAVIIPGATVAIFLYFTSDRETLCRMRVPQGLAILAVIILPWFLSMWFLYGDEFTNHIISKEIKNRVDNQSSLNFYYFGVLFRYFLPWSLFAIFSLAIHFGITTVAPGKNSGVRTYLSSLPKNILKTSSKLAQKEGAPVLFCLLWIACMVLLFTFVRFQALRYMLPTAPAMAMLAADFLSRNVIRAKAFHRPIFKFPFILLLVFYSALAIAAGLVALYYSSTYPKPIGLLILPGLLATGILMILMMYRLQINKPLILAMALFQIVAMAPLNGDVIAYFRGYPMQNISRDILKNTTGNEWIGVYVPIEVKVINGHYYRRLETMILHPSLRIKTPEELREFLDTDDKIFFLIREQDFSEEIRRLPLAVLATRQTRKRSKLKLKQAWELVQKRDIKGASEGKYETWILLTNQVELPNH